MPMSTPTDSKADQKTNSRADGKAPAPRSAAARRAHWDVRELVTLAIFCAMSMALSFFKVPIFPVAPYLLYDPSGIVSLTAALMFGPGAGVVVQVISWLPMLIMEPLGTLLTFVAMTAMVIVCGLIYKRWHTLPGAVAGLVISAVPFILLAIGMNFLITPLYTPGATVADVAALVLPVLVPFNLLKCGINIVVTILIYKPVSNLVKNRDARSHA